MSRRLPRQGLYVITRELPGGGGLASLDGVAAAIRGGAGMVQYRVKRAAEPERDAWRLLELCRRAGIPLIVNDDIELAFRVGADGVHLGRDDAGLPLARRRLGAGAIIGVSCYNDVGQAERAVEEGADYVAFGRFFPSLTKPDAPCADLATLAAARSRLTVPIVAIGGITTDNAQCLLAAGAGWLAVIEGVLGQPDPEHAAREFRRIWPHGGAPDP